MIEKMKKKLISTIFVPFFGHCGSGQKKPEGWAENFLSSTTSTGSASEQGLML